MQQHTQEFSKVKFVKEVGVEVVEQWNFNIYIGNHLATAATRS